MITHHRAFIARRRTERPSEEYRDLTAAEWEEFLAHSELRKVALGTCGRDHGTPCQQENACVSGPLLRVDPAQMPRLEGIRANLLDRLREATEQGWLGEVAAIETTLAAADQKTRRHAGRPQRDHLPEWGQMLVRAMIYRIATRDKAFGPAGWTPDQVDAYRPVIELAINHAETGPN